MLNTEQILTTLQQLPLPERVSVLDALNSSVEAEYDQLAEQSLRDDILLVEQRLAEFDAGEIDSLPWNEVRLRVFGH
jgi:putative addiction module component (TIGR02574 family)